MTKFDLPEQIVGTAQDLSECCAYLETCSKFGFDTEFVGEETYHPRLCLVQVATAERLILIDPLTSGPLDAFWKLVVDPGRLVIVHAGREEVRLCRLWTGHVPGNLFDLQIAAGLAGLAYPLGHAALVSHALGVQIAKGETLTEWRERPLTPQQIRYAFDDVRYLLPLWRRLRDRLQERGREGWAREEFTRLAASAAPDEPALEKWRKLRGLGSLDRRRLAVVRELNHWREGVAARTNRPARTVVRDDLLIEIARRNPYREGDLSVIRGLPRRDVPAILQAVQRARALPLDECPELADREQDPPQVQLVTNVLLAVHGDFCTRQALAANLVANTQDIRGLVRARMNGESLPGGSLLMQGWRKEHVLPHLLAVLDGRRTLRIADIESETPLTVSDG
ncbi:MAG TPA: HRDC domain-containing protein [Gemmataceae bacterium]|jgi:ribonuclease D|nr:HRDC domain-containing protein [Gemmataceae bacterium]